VAEHATRPVAVVPEPLPRRGGDWPFTSVAVGHDGTSTGAGALAWATTLAVASSSSLLVVHALELAPAFAVSGVDDDYEAVRDRVVDAVDAEWCAPLRAAGLTYAAVVAEGGPAVVILDAVRSRGADLLVVGRQANPSFPGMAMGSVAHRALGFAPCPTVVVPAGV
jgi:nucleotide-binding universal stress UspA family protein